MTERELIIGKAYTYFAITSDTLTEADYLHWLGMEPDSYEEHNWIIGTSLTINTSHFNRVSSIVKRLIPLKDRLIAFKQANPDLD